MDAEGASKYCQKCGIPYKVNQKNGFTLTTACQCGYHKQMFQFWQKEQKKENIIQSLTTAPHTSQLNYSFKVAHQGLIEICKENNLGSLICLQKPGSKQYFVLLLCYLQKELGQSRKQLFNGLPQLYSKKTQAKVQKFKNIMKQNSEDSIRAYNCLNILKTAQEVIKTYVVEKSPQKAMILWYGDTKFPMILNKAIEKLIELRTKLGLKEYKNE